jgi:hypothetical protein
MTRRIKYNYFVFTKIPFDGGVFKYSQNIKFNFNGRLETPLNKVQNEI